MNDALGRRTMRRLLELHDSGLVRSRHTQPWAAQWIEKLERPPAWLCELATLLYERDVARCLREHVLSPPFEDFDLDALADLHVAALLLRHEQGELSWATCLRKAGDYADRIQAGAQDCEFYYALLNELEHAEFDRAVETRQLAEVQALLGAALDLARSDFAPLLRAFRANRDGGGSAR